MTTNVPASLPERLADAEGELPEEIVRAINRCGALAAKLGRAPAADQPMFDRLYGEARAVLTATILSRLTAAESARAAPVAERDEALRVSAEALELVRKYAVEAMTAEAERDAALNNSALAKETKL